MIIILGLCNAFVKGSELKVRGIFSEPAIIHYLARRTIGHGMVIYDTAFELSNTHYQIHQFSNAKAEILGDIEGLAQTYYRRASNHLKNYFGKVSRIEPLANGRAAAPISI